ncbi:MULTISPECIES: SusD/RagB family nutrient-binding outer membrane lipoprotein [Niastella]|uniref:SusD/RagB family nutrient-binding outer membrane lipoprotein n=1 Tax=Niastella soli TaxID=2821487 RepID=A0ABS3Z417_9BACT|nr:SusD/RagB family nutrient-binding outer membrane lipoprotein [Niastella soli]MBO9204903.1 SusD/RagB family nutrient-binding outer membrane lipoprotein [Niastella soli]
MTTHYIKKSCITLLLLTAIGIAGCKKYLDTNDNPNLSTTASPDLLLPAVQAAIGHVLGNPLQIYGSFWAQYWTQNPKSSQYRSIDQYASTTTDFDRVWRMMYSDALQDIQEILNLTQGKESLNQYTAIALLMKAYDMQLATDAFGDIPLTQAAIPNVTNPSYTSQQQVYDSIFAYTDRAIALIDVNAEVTPSSDDLIFQGDMEQWLRFANTFKLRTGLRLSAVAPQISVQILAPLSLSGTLFLETDAQINYSTIGGNQNPLFSEMLGLGRTQNMVASETVAKFMTQNHDPRADVFFNRYINSSGVDSIIGIKQGSYRTNTSTYSLPSPVVGANGQNDKSANAPVKFMSAAESYFLQAEAVARGWLISPLSAQALFTKGIEASFTSYNVPGLSTYLASAPAAQWPAGTQAQIRAIIIQKWLAMTGNQGFEAFTEWRRTNYPDFFTTSAASTIGAGRMPERLIYPNSEVTRNANFPGIALIYIKVWWDAN